MCGAPDTVAPDGADGGAAAGGGGGDGGAAGEEAESSEPPLPSQAEMVQARNDQIFEDFKKKLVEGIPLVKHCSDKQARKRIIFSDSLFTKIGWMEAGAVKSKAEQILSITEVRRATDVDPKTLSGGQSMSGTEILRGSMHVAYKKMAFSLIMPSRTLDLQCESEAECNTLVSCFNRLLTPP